MASSHSSLLCTISVPDPITIPSKKSLYLRKLNYLKRKNVNLVNFFSKFILFRQSKAKSILYIYKYKQPKCSVSDKQHNPFTLFRSRSRKFYLFYKITKWVKRKTFLITSFLLFISCVVYELFLHSFFSSIQLPC